MAAQKVQETFFIVDWDLPLTKERFGFYRSLKKLRKEMNVEEEMSSKSVLITEDEKFALAVYDIAAKYAVLFHIYTAKTHTCATKINKKEAIKDMVMQYG